MTAEKKLFAEAYHQSGRQALIDLYERWADSYDSELLGELGLTGPLQLVEAMAEMESDRTLAIIDLGCGTGLAGEALAAEGFSVIDGLDFSPAMLAKAREKDVYRSLMEGDVLAGTGIDDGAYEVVATAGLFSPGHVGPEAIAETLRILAPGGRAYLMVQGQAYVDEPYAKTLARIQAAETATIILNKRCDGVLSNGGHANLIGMRKSQ